MELFTQRSEKKRLKKSLKKMSSPVKPAIPSLLSAIPRPNPVTYPVPARRSQRSRLPRNP